MQIGTVFTVEGCQFTIKNVDGDRVDASLLVVDKKDGKTLRPQRGRPRMFDKSIVMKALGLGQESEISEPESVVQPEPTPIVDNSETIKNLLNSMGDAPANDW
jgi:hypothetical protein